MKLGEEVEVFAKYKRVYSPYTIHGQGRTRCTWVLQRINPIKGIICGIRILGNGAMTSEGFIFDETLKVCMVAINLKQIIYVPI